MKAIDLGLSVNWADCNLGANSPSEVGNLYAWGKLTPKEKYTWENYRDWKYSGLYGPYKESHFMREIHKIEVYDDAVAFNYGDSWRIPTVDDFKELLTKCRWVPSKECGQYGYRIYGTTGQSIFLPSCNVENYWSATRMSSPQHAHVLAIRQNPPQLFYRSRFYGYNLRGVCKKM